eukprot:393014-Amphidinium_carterae.1
MPQEKVTPAERPGIEHQSVVQEMSVAASWTQKPKAVCDNVSPQNATGLIFTSKGSRWSYNSSINMTLTSMFSTQSHKMSDMVSVVPDV